MSESAHLTALRTILQFLYETEVSARRVVAEAGLDSSAILFSTSAKDNWFAIFNEAQKHERVDVLIEVALRDFPNRADLRKACNTYRASTAGQTEGIASEKPVATPPLTLQLL